MAEQYARNKGRNVTITGYPGMDYFTYGIEVMIMYGKS